MLGHNLFCFKENQGKNNSNKKILFFPPSCWQKLKILTFKGKIKETCRKVVILWEEMSRGTKDFTGIDYGYFFGITMDTWVLTKPFLKVKVKVAQSCPTLCDPMDYTVHGILQARILEWVAFSFSFSSRSSRPRNPTEICIAGGFFNN